MPLLAMLHLATTAVASAEHNGLALTPPMGWNPWNCYANRGGGVGEDIVLGAAHAMAEKLKPAGYEYINLDCGWSAKHRDPQTGELLVNATRFPHGMKWLGDQIHHVRSRMWWYLPQASAVVPAPVWCGGTCLRRCCCCLQLGLKFGMYGALGYRQCCSGSADPTAADGSGPGCDKARKVCRNQTYFDLDAVLWASWGVDLLKFDGCGGPFESVEPMRDALRASGRPIVYSVHSSVEKNVMNASLANMWRTGPDIGASYEQVLDRAMISNNVSKYLGGAPGGWNDPVSTQQPAHCG
jgi:alpha-galactosidase